MEEKKSQTCDVYRIDPKLPSRFNNPSCFHGYGAKEVHPLYQTTNQTYGGCKPSVHDMPTRFKSCSSQFSDAMLQSGMYRDHGFNTDKNTHGFTASSAQINRLKHHFLRHHGNQSDEQPMKSMKADHQ